MTRARRRHCGRYITAQPAGRGGGRRRSTPVPGAAHMRRRRSGPGPRAAHMRRRMLRGLGDTGGTRDRARDQPKRLLPSLAGHRQSPRDAQRGRQRLAPRVRHLPPALSEAAGERSAAGSAACCQGRRQPPTRPSGTPRLPQRLCGGPGLAAAACPRLRAAGGLWSSQGPGRCPLHILLAAVSSSRPGSQSPEAPEAVCLAHAYQTRCRSPGGIFHEKGRYYPVMSVHQLLG